MLCTINYFYFRKFAIGLMFKIEQKVFSLETKMKAKNLMRYIIANLELVFGWQMPRYLSAAIERQAYVDPTVETRDLCKSKCSLQHCI